MQTFQHRRGGPPLRVSFRTTMEGQIDETVLQALSTCIREEFEETYPDKTAYDPSKLVEMVVGKRLISAAAFDETDEPLATISIKDCPPFHGVGDLSMHVVRFSYRAYGLGTPLVRYVMDLPQSRELACVVSHSAMYHTIAQHESYRVGLRPCGILYSIFRDLQSQSFRVNSRKQSFLVAACPKRKNDAGTLYVPKIHRDFVKDCYNRMEVRYQFVEAAEDLSDESLLRAVQDHFQQNLMITVDCCGPRLGDQVDEMMWYWGNDYPLQTVTLFLNLNHPSAVAGYRILAERGFFFAGLHPLSYGAEYAILHHPMHVEIPFESFCVDEQYQAVFEYLRKQFNH